MTVRLLVAAAAFALAADSASAQLRKPISGPVIVTQPTKSPTLSPLVPSTGTPILPTYTDPFTGVSTTTGRTVDPRTGVVTNFGTASNPYTGISKSVTTSVDPFTGATVTRTTTTNPLTGRTSTSTAVNPLTGAYSTTSKFQPSPFANPFANPNPFAPVGPAVGPFVR